MVVSCTLYVLTQQLIVHCTVTKTNVKLYTVNTALVLTRISIIITHMQLP